MFNVLTIIQKYSYETSKGDCLECLSHLKFRNNVVLQQCCISLTGDTNCFETRLCDFLSKKWTNYEVSKEVIRDCQFRLLQRYLNKWIWSCRSVVLIWQLWVSTAPESMKCASFVQSTVWSQSCCSFMLLNTKSRSREGSVLGYVAICRNTVSGFFSVLSSHFRPTLLSVS